MPPARQIQDGFSWERFLSGQSGVLLGFLIFGLTCWKLLMPFVRAQIGSIVDVVRELREEIHAARQEAKEEHLRQIRSMDKLSRVVAAAVMGRIEYNQQSKSECKDVLGELNSERDT